MPRKIAPSTKDKILKVAELEFRARSFEGASIRDIAQKAGLSTGAIYNLFTDKYELFDECTQDVRAQLISKWVSAYEQSKHVYSLERQSIEQSYDLELAAIKNIIAFVFENRDDLRLVVIQAKGSHSDNFLQDLQRLGLLGEVAFSLIQLKLKNLNEEHNIRLQHLLSSSIIEYYHWLIEEAQSQEEALELAKPLLAHSLLGYLSIKKNLGFNKPKP
ncbi:MAG: TetR/AcrR family transcriptional regulator [Coriobacteriia bacterium]|nr:TetR/AcrR family transcriptional regulator [Coriobacteriia bacterium]